MVSPSLSPWILAEATPIPGAQQNVISVTKGMPETHSLSAYRARLAAASLQHRPAIVSTNSLGNITATFRIPGHINVPSDFQQHNVTISSFEFKAPFLWYTFLKANARMYMEVWFLV